MAPPAPQLCRLFVIRITDGIIVLALRLRRVAVTSRLFPFRRFEKLEGLKTACSAKRDCHGRALVTVLMEFQAVRKGTSGKCRITAYTQSSSPIR